MRLARITFVLLVMVALASCAYAQSVDAAATTTAPATASPQQMAVILAAIGGILTSLKGGDKLGALIIFVNLLVNMLKMPWFQNIVKRVIARKRKWKLSPRGKVLCVLGIGVTSTYFLFPSAVWYRTFLKGLIVAFAAMGAHDTYQYLLCGHTHKSKAADPEEASA